MRHRSGTAGAVLAVLVVAGCSGDSGEASPSPTPTSSDSPAASPSTSQSSAAPPRVPTVAKQRSRAGAIEFALFFIEAVNYTIASGDTKWFSTLYLDACQACEGIVEETRQIHDTGGSVQGGELIVNTYSAVRGNDSTWSVGIQADAGRQTIKPRPDGTEQIRTGGTYQITVDVKRRSTDWVVARMVVTES